MIRVKFCGMTRREDIDAAVSLGVHAIGLIFYSKSKRFISIDDAISLLQPFPRLTLIQAVLVNPDEAFVSELLNKVPIHQLQFHGDETEDFCLKFNRPYIKAIQANDRQSILSTMKNHPNACGYLLDTPTDGYGGSGQCFDWSMINDIDCSKFILAGGINDSNCLDAVRESGISALDVCSGIESSAGIKDVLKMTKFMQQIRGYHD